MKTEISSTDFVRGIGDCLARVRYRSESFVILKNDTPIALVSPLPDTPALSRGTLADFVKAWSEPKCDPEFADTLDKINSSDRPLRNPWAS
jgi:hypothetical protein